MICDMRYAARQRGRIAPKESDKIQRGREGLRIHIHSFIFSLLEKKSFVFLSSPEAFYDRGGRRRNLITFAQGKRERGGRKKKVCMVLGKKGVWGSGFSPLVFLLLPPYVSFYFLSFSSGLVRIEVSYLFPPSLFHRRDIAAGQTTAASNLHMTRNVFPHLFFFIILPYYKMDFPRRSLSLLGTFAKEKNWSKFFLSLLF